MLQNRIVQVGLGVAAGFIAATLLNFRGSPEDAAATNSERARRPDPIAFHESGTGQPSSGEDSSGQDEGAPSALHPDGTPQDPNVAFAGYADAARSFRKKIELDRLHNAGFSDDRIAWLEQRAAELKLQKNEYWSKLAQEGRPASGHERSAYILDPDLDLQQEIGEDEYDRYREALGRTLGVAIVDVTIGSSGQSSGLMAGDEIVRYDGKRVYNVAALDGLTSGATSDGQAIVEIRRQGRLIQLSVPKGPLLPLGVRSELPSEADSRTRLKAYGLPRRPSTEPE